MKTRCPECNSTYAYKPAEYVDQGATIQKVAPAYCEECGWEEYFEGYPQADDNSDTNTDDTDETTDSNSNSDEDPHKQDTIWPV